ncbi:MAG: conjugal transfer protein TraF [Acidobacteria bacterium]|nr:conjugal transfer protein TraF [Acidobacteriota bacterium]
MVSIRCNGPIACGLLAGLFLVTNLAAAQTPGTRAAGMAEAFVGVADDATAVYWNPAGMATGAYFSFVVDFADGEGLSEGPDEDPGASSHDARFIGLTVPSLGLAYYRLSRVAAGPAAPAEGGAVGRQDGRRSVRGLTTSHVGLTLGQSLTDYLVVAGTFKIVRGRVTRGVAEGPDVSAALASAEGLAGRQTSRFDIDAGVMMTVDRWRVGLVARNLTMPSFASPDPEAVPVDLDREVRAGAAWGSGWPGLSRVVVSADADLTHRAAPSGDRRDVAAGVETWWAGQRVGLRGGVRASATGDLRPVVAAGVSAALRPGAFVEAHVARGTRDERSWSIGARVTF